MGKRLEWAPPHIAQPLENALALEAKVSERAVRRLRADPSHRRDAEILPGGSFDGRPRDYAMSLYTFYLCENCGDCYFGGERHCVAEQPNTSAREANEKQVCGGCSATSSGAKCKAGHDPSFLEWKCRSCCSVAVWFCWGKAHFCDRCHQHPHAPPTSCPGMSKCPLRTVGVKSHPPNGGDAGELCLGCSLCRNKDFV